ncbi:MAG: ComEC/Rec2 family competence protein [Patescibacteria group bacterium]
MKSYKKISFIILVIVLVISIFLIILFSQYSRNVKVVFLDVGQGDAILIQAPGNIDVLIDGGPDKKVLSGLGKHLPFWDRKIELVILTHPHTDHLQGLIEVLKSYKVERIIDSQIDYTGADYQDWLRVTQEKKIPLEKTVNGDRFNLGENTYLKTLYPLTDITGQKFENLNDTSIVTELIDGSYSFLFTGDSRAEEEKEMLAADLISGVEVLKVGHHGSKYSSSPPFLTQLSPSYAVFQVGKNNRFGHPHLITLQRLEKIGARIFRTDTDGEVICERKKALLTCY